MYSPEFRIQPFFQITTQPLHQTQSIDLFTAAGVYLSEGRHPIIPITPCIHATMQPCDHAISIFQIAYHPSPHSPNSPISLHPIIPVVSAANYVLLKIYKSLILEILSNSALPVTVKLSDFKVIQVKVTSNIKKSKADCCKLEDKISKMLTAKKLFEKEGGGRVLIAAGTTKQARKHTAKQIVKFIKRHM